MPQYPLSLATLASSPKGTPLGYAGNLTAATKSRPLGEGVTAIAVTEGVLPGKQAFRFSHKLSRHAKGPISEGAGIAQR